MLIMFGFIMSNNVTIKYNQITYYFVLLLSSKKFKVYNRASLYAKSILLNVL